MRKLILLLAGGAVFLLGYYSGRKPGSPDIVGWASQKAGQFSQSPGGRMLDHALASARQSVQNFFTNPKQPSPAQGNQSDATPSADNPPANRQSAGDHPPMSAARSAPSPGQERPGIPQCY